ncbi:hypothetical protein L218DRAFT_959484 [Marasmius fiardii PR-910]|nr:hypothetical protein L218DRAFT_959484 [Marasmius fiardii PR-910]
MSTSLSRITLRPISRSLAQACRKSVHTYATPSHLPFDPTNKRAFAMKFIAYVGTGFALPFVATYWLWHRPGGLKNPEGQWPEWVP